MTNQSGRARIYRVAWNAVARGNRANWGQKKSQAHLYSSRSSGSRWAPDSNQDEEHSESLSKEIETIGDKSFEVSNLSRTRFSDDESLPSALAPPSLPLRGRRPLWKKFKKSFVICPVILRHLCPYLTAGAADAVQRDQVHGAGALQKWIVSLCARRI